MKKYFLFMVMALPLCALAQEKPKEENKKLELKPYGFVKGDMVYATRGVYSWGNEHYVTYLLPSLQAVKILLHLALHHSIHALV